MSVSLYRRPDSKFWWAAITLPDGGTLRRSTKTADRKAAKTWACQTESKVWQQQRLGIKPEYLWQDAVIRWCEETSHKKSHHDDVAKFRWFDQHLKGMHWQVLRR